MWYVVTLLHTFAGTIVGIAVSTNSRTESIASDKPEWFRMPEDGIWLMYSCKCDLVACGAHFMASCTMPLHLAVKSFTIICNSHNVIEIIFYFNK